MKRRDFLLLAGGAAVMPAVARGDVCLANPSRDYSGWRKMWDPPGIDTPNPSTRQTPPAMQFDEASAVAFEGAKNSFPRRGWSTVDPVNDKQLLQDVRDGYCLMRSLPQCDPRSLLAQTWLHAYYCGGGWAGGDLHHSWGFLPWHRAFVYFHEQILGSLLGKPEFRLPYWDWDQQGKVPQLFVDLGLPDFLDSAGRLDPGPVAKWVDRCGLQAWLMSDSFNTFMGPENEKGPQGMASNGPHGEAHAMVGGAMRNPATAAADPVFYSHHGNVDRFWWYWQQKYPSFAPAPLNWSKQEFFFHDAQSRLVRVKASDVVDIGNLGYTYDRQPMVPLCDLQSLDINLNDLQGAATGLLTRLKHLTLAGLLSTGSSAILHFSNYLNGKIEFSDLLQSDCLSSFPIRTELTLPSAEIKPGQYYVVGLRRDKFYKVGGFGVFASPAHLAMGATVQVIATGCLDPDLFSALLKGPSGFEVVYGESRDGSNPAATALHPINGEWLVKMLYPKGYVDSAMELLGSFGTP